MSCSLPTPSPPPTINAVLASPTKTSITERGLGGAREGGCQLHQRPQHDVVGQYPLLPSHLHAHKDAPPSSPPTMGSITGELVRRRWQIQKAELVPFQPPLLPPPTPPQHTIVRPEPHTHATHHVSWLVQKPRRASRWLGRRLLTSLPPASPASAVPLACPMTLPCNDGRGAGERA